VQFGASLGVGAPSADEPKHRQLTAGQPERCRARAAAAAARSGAAFNRRQIAVVDMWSM